MASIWNRASYWAAKYVQEMYGAKWDEDRIAHQYMAARNGFLAGHKARAADEYRNSLRAESNRKGIASRRR